MNAAWTRYLLSAAVIGAVPSGAAAQTTASPTITIQVSVANGLTVLKDRDLDFGVVAAGSGPNALGLASANIGKLHIVGGQNKQVTVTLTPPAVLQNGASSIAYAWAAAYNEALDAPTDPTTVTFGTATATFRLKDAAVWKNYGQAYLYIYGSVDVGAVVPGLYAGTFTVTAAY